MGTKLSSIKEKLKKRGNSEKATKEILAWYASPKKKTGKHGR